MIASDEKSVVIGVRQPDTEEIGQIQISFDGPDRFWVNPAGGEGWKEYYQRIEKRS